MKYFFYLIAFSFLLSSCNSKSDKPEDQPLNVLTIQPSENNIEIRKAITEIETGDLQTAGLKVLSLQIDGMEVLKISLKDYYTDERNNQETDFKKYMEYLDRYANARNPLGTHSSRSESRAKHDAVIKYLDHLIRTTSSGATVYKVIYHLNAATNASPYNQLKTTYLDEHFKKMVLNYSQLKPALPAGK